MIWEGEMFDAHFHRHHWAKEQMERTLTFFSIFVPPPSTARGSHSPPPRSSLFRTPFPAGKNLLSSSRLFSLYFLCLALRLASSPLAFSLLSSNSSMQRDTYTGFELLLSLICGYEMPWKSSDPCQVNNNHREHFVRLHFFFFHSCNKLFFIQWNKLFLQNFYQA